MTAGDESSVKKTQEGRGEPRARECAALPAQVCGESTRVHGVRAHRGQEGVPSRAPTGQSPAGGGVVVRGLVDRYLPEHLSRQGEAGQRAPGAFREGGGPGGQEAEAPQQPPRA